MQAKGGAWVRAACATWRCGAPTSRVQSARAAGGVRVEMHADSSVSAAAVRCCQRWRRRWGGSTAGGSCRERGVIAERGAVAQRAMAEGAGGRWERQGSGYGAECQG